MPSIDLAAEFNKEGFPVGMELVVLPYYEPDLFRLGAEFEAVTPQRRSPENKASVNANRAPVK